MVFNDILISNELYFIDIWQDFMAKNHKSKANVFKFTHSFVTATSMTCSNVQKALLNNGALLK